MGDSVAETEHSAAARRGIARRVSPWLQIGAIRKYVWSRHRVPIKRLPPGLEGFRLIQLSDLHLCENRWHPGLDRVIEEIRRDAPDLICITGDFIDDRHDPRPAAALVERFVTQLQARMGVYAVLGNHDGDLLGPRLPGWGVRLMTGEHLTLPAAGDDGAIELIGLAGVHREDLFVETLAARLPEKRGDAARIVLSHYPDALSRATALDADVFLAGHTHGGQICLPGGVPMLTHDALPRKLSRGLHRIGTTWLSVSRGMGYTNQAVRLFAPAEVVELTLTAER